MEAGSPQKAQQRPERNFLQDKEAAGTHVLMEVERWRPNCFLVSDFSSVPFGLWLNFLWFLVNLRGLQAPSCGGLTLCWTCLPSCIVCVVFPSEGDGLFCLPHSCKCQCSSFLARFSSGFLQLSSWVCLLHGCPAGMVFT